MFIERGKLLRAGTLEQLLKQDVSHRTVVIRPLDRLEELHRDLLVQPGIEEVAGDQASRSADSGVTGPGRAWS